MAADDSEPIGLEIRFVGAEDVPVLFANSFVVQNERDTFILTAAQLVPPLLLGTPDEQREQAKALDHVPVRVVTRLALTVNQARELASLLATTIKRYEEKAQNND